MGRDLSLVGYRFNWTLTVFFISYAVIEVPSNIAIRIIGGKYYIPFLVVSFAIISMSTAFVQNFSGLVACRFMLGLAEGGMMPGIAFYLSTFYRRHELAFRVGMFILGASLAGAFGSLLAAGLSPIPEWGAPSARIHDWRNIFFFEGLLSIICGLVAIYFLPSSPDKCKFLSETDRYIALERIQQENREEHAERVRLHHVYRAVFNINNTICGIGLGLINISVQSVSLFLPTILSALGWTALKTQLYSVPPFVVASIYAITSCWLSDAFKKRGAFAIVNSCVCIIGFVILITANSNGAKYVATFFACAGSFPSGPAYITWGMNNASGPTIRAVSAAYITMWGQVGAIVATWAYLPHDAPQYRTGHSINLAAHCLAILCALIGIFYVKWENKMRDRGKRDHRLQDLTREQELLLGYRHPRLRYMA
jgi:MFS family permease